MSLETSQLNLDGLPPVTGADAALLRSSPPGASSLSGSLRASLAALGVPVTSTEPLAGKGKAGFIGSSPPCVSDHEGVKAHRAGGRPVAGGARPALGVTLLGP